MTKLRKTSFWKLYFYKCTDLESFSTNSTHMSTEWIHVFLQQISEMETQYKVIYMKNIFSEMYEGRGHYAGLHVSFSSFFFSQ